ncbi:MAG: peptidylprolyl isomerase [Firmicutes bacterium]|nr:peptidylprolyl isomerase [Bacillota bacterium]
MNLRKHRTFIFIILVAVLLGLTITAIPTFSRDTVATVNGHKISKEELDRKVRWLSFIYPGYDFASQPAQVAETMALEYLLIDEAKRHGLKVGKDELDKAVEELLFTLALQRTGGDEKALESLLYKAGLSVRLAREMLREQELSAKLYEDVTKDVQVTDEDVRKYYDENPDFFTEQEQVKARHILVSSREESEKILSELKNGADFAAIAGEKNSDATKSQGGDLGYFSKGRMVPEFEEAAFKLQPGELSGVVQTQFGFHIIKVEDRKPEVKKSFEESQEDARDLLLDDRKGQAFDAYLTDLKAKANIETKGLTGK